MTACGNTLTKTQTEHYINVLDFYLQFKILNNENRVAAKSLLTYLETHQADPDNRFLFVLIPFSIFPHFSREISNSKFSNVNVYNLFNAILCYFMLFYSILCYFMLFYAILCYFMLFYAILCYFMLFYAILCYLMLFYAI
jgi:hypothetical protein